MDANSSGKGRATGREALRARLERGPKDHGRVLRARSIKDRHGKVTRVQRGSRRRRKGHCGGIRKVLRARLGNPGRYAKDYGYDG